MGEKFQSGGAIQEREVESDIARYWRQYNFPHKPPRPGTVAEERLRKACEEYSTFVLDPNKHGATGSEGRRRQLHNEIAVMTVGRERTNMDITLAEEIADFACCVAYGLPANEALADIEKYRRLNQNQN